MVALSGLENILRFGKADNPTADDSNPYAVQIEECYGLDKIEFLQSHENLDIYKKAFKVVETYFGSEEGDTDAQVNPAVASDQQFFQFNGPQGSNQAPAAAADSTHTAPGAVFQF